jgi:hypothetical protein
MTFAEFQSTRKWFDDLTTVISDCRWGDEPGSPAGYVYLDALYIERVQSHWPQAVRDAGTWCLLLGNEEYVTHDLVEVEAKLYEWADSAGYFDA